MYLHLCPKKKIKEKCVLSKVMTLMCILGFVIVVNQLYDGNKIEDLLFGTLWLWEFIVHVSKEIRVKSLLKVIKSRRYNLKENKLKIPFGTSLCIKNIIVATHVELDQQ